MKQQLEEAHRVLRGKNVLVFGGCGFIGSNLARRLLTFEARVKVFDKAIANPHPDIDYVEGDIQDYDTVLHAIKGSDIVFQLAAVLGVEKIVKVPFKVMEVNLMGAKNVLMAASRVGVKRILFSSSSEVYGEPRKLPISEDDDKSPLSIYGVSKLAAEAYCQAYKEEFNLPITTVRYFNVYGPGQEEKFIMTKFIARAFRGRPPIIYGHGNQSRCYTFVDDAVNGTILAASLKAGEGEVFNIGSEEEMTVLELGLLIPKMVHANFNGHGANGNGGFNGKNNGNGLYPIFKSFGEGIRVEQREIFRRKPDILKAKTLLGFRNNVPLKDGLSRFIDWYATRRKEAELVEC